MWWLRDVLRSDADELTKFDIARRVNRDASDEVELFDEPPGRVEILERSVPGGATPSPDDPEATAAYPVAAHIHHELLRTLPGNDERAENLSPSFEACSQVCFFEGVSQPISPTHEISSGPRDRPVRE